MSARKHRRERKNRQRDEVQTYHLSICVSAKSKKDAFATALHVSRTHWNIADEEDSAMYPSRMGASDHPYDEWEPEGETLSWDEEAEHLKLV